MADRRVLGGAGGRVGADGNTVSIDELPQMTFHSDRNSSISAKRNRPILVREGVGFRGKEEEGAKRILAHQSQQRIRATRHTKWVMCFGQGGVK